MSRFEDAIEGENSCFQENAAMSKDDQILSDSEDEILSEEEEDWPSSDGQFDDDLHECTGDLTKRYNRLKTMQQRIISTAIQNKTSKETSPSLIAENTESAIASETPSKWTDSSMAAALASKFANRIRLTAMNDQQTASADSQWSSRKASGNKYAISFR